MAEEGVNIEMGERGEEEEREDNINETSFIDDNNEDSESDYSIFRPSDRVTRVGDFVPDIGIDVGSMKRSITRDKKEIFLTKLGVKINKGDGTSSKNIIEQTEFTFNKKGRVTGAWFNGVKVLVSKGGEIRYSKNKSKNVVESITLFKELLEKARIEHYNTAEGVVEEITGDSTLPKEVVDDILSRSSSAINGWVEEMEEEVQKQVRKIFISEQEVRDISGVVNIHGEDTDIIYYLKIEADYYRTKANKEADPLKKQFYDNVIRMVELKADSIRIRINERPEHTEAMSILSNEVENNDLNRLERFKRWAKENMVGLSAIAITIAGIVTTIVVAARRTVSGGARAVGGFAKALANLGKSLGPLLAPLFSVIAQVLTWGAKGIAWLANNLWVLAIAMTWLLYDYWKNRK